MSKINIQGPGLLTLLGVAFVVLKLCGVIHWSWWMVTLPLWIGWALVLGIAAACLLAGFVCLGIAALLE